MSNFESHCQKMNTLISIGAKRSTKQMADDVLWYVTDRMKELDPAFASMYKGNKITGSYADDLKISCPNEFDYVLKVKLPLLSQCQVRNTESTRHLVHPPSILFVSFGQLTKTVPGYVKINAAHLQKFNQLNQEKVMKVVRTFIGPSGHLLKSPFAAWIHYLLDRVFAGLKKLSIRGKYMLQTNGNSYEVCSW